MEEQRELTPAEKYYQKHRARMNEYNKKNKDLINERNRQRYTKMVEDEEKHKKYLEKRREAYKRKQIAKSSDKTLTQNLS